MQGNTTDTSSFDYLFHCAKTVLASKLTSPATGVHLYTNIAVITLNTVLSVAGTLTNLLVIWAFVLNQSLRTCSNMILLVLGVSDVIVTGVVQPIYIVLKLNEIRGAHNCLLKQIFAAAAFLSCGVSMLTLVLLSAECFLTLACPYQRHIVTRSRLKTALAAIWVATLIFSMLQYVLQSSSWYIYFTAVIMVSSVSLIVPMWIWIYLLVRRHKRAIDNLQSPYTMRNTGMHQQRALVNAKTSLLIVATVLSCYFPDIVVKLYFETKGGSFQLFYLIAPWSHSLLFANSVSNPLVMCMRKKAFRETIARVRRQVSAS